MASELVELPPSPLRREEEGEEGTVCALGGPIFDQGYVGPLTSVLEFEASVLSGLQDLEDELCADLAEPCDIDLSINDLKVLTNEDIDKALKEVLKDHEVAGSTSPCSKEALLEKSNGHKDLTEELSCLENSGQEISAALTIEHRRQSDSEMVDQEKSTTKKKKKKRGRKFDRNSRAAELDNATTSKVEELAKIMKRQEEDKAKVTLHSLRFQRDEKTTSVAEASQRTTSPSFVSSSSKVKSQAPHEFIPICVPEMVLCVEIHHNIRRNQKVQEFLVLGKQTLAELRDKIHCATDVLMQKEGVHDPSGYFLIEDTFCNDLRDPSAVDYSQTIFNWLRSEKDEVLAKWDAIVTGSTLKKLKTSFKDMPKSHIPTFKSLIMHQTRFCDLRFRLGCGYLYCHQGDCRHTVVIRDMRLFHADDVQNMAAYPLLTFQLRSLHRKCSICTLFIATKVTIDDKHAPENPSYFCDNCYFLLHYSEEGTLLYDDFTVYDYYCE